MACLDTSAILDLTAPVTTAAALRVRALLSGLADRGESFATTRFTVAELLVGVERSRDAEREARRVAAALTGLDILEFDQAGAASFARIKADLLRTGRPVGDLDILIGATALAHGETMVTRNSRDFDGMPGLRVLGY
jgi:tRNA(fMet)-specific endonuclease VapC